VHYPSNLQPGAIYPRKCGNFGVCREGFQSQVSNMHKQNYQINNVFTKHVQVD